MSVPQPQHIATLRSPVKDGMFGARERIDPYWEGLWVQGSTAMWASQIDAREQEKAELVYLPRWARCDKAEAVDRVVHGNRRRRLRTLRMLAATNEFRTLTYEQLACVTGDPGLADIVRNPGLVGDAFAAGLVDLGSTPSVWKRRQRMFHSDLIRPARTAAFDRDVAPWLTYPEWVQVTGGVAWVTGGQYDRHNVLCTELALRVAEFCTPDVGAVLGELHSGLSLLTTSGVSDEFDAVHGKVADGLIVRADGVRIAIEMTASVSRQFSDKVESWARLLADNPWDMTGLMVLFVAAPTPSSVAEGHGGDSLETQVRRVVAEMAKRYPGAPNSSSGWTSERMAVVKWADWFPGKHQTSKDFETLTVSRPTGHSEAVWEKAALLDFFDGLPFEPHERHDPTALLRNLPWLGGVPHWLKRDLSDDYEPPHLWALAVDASDRGEIPVPIHPRHFGDVGAAHFAEAKGATDTPRPPRRMRPFPLPRAGADHH